VLDGEAGRPAARPHLQLGIDRAQVSVDGGGAHDQVGGDLSVGEAGGEQAQDLDLAGGQASAQSRGQRPSLGKRGDGGFGVIPLPCAQAAANAAASIWVRAALRLRS
jgi:hypothetical protein